MINNFIKDLLKSFQVSFETIRFIVNIAKMYNFKEAYYFSSQLDINVIYNQVKSLTLAHMFSL